jgi:hypothetical protein
MEQSHYLIKLKYPNFSHGIPTSAIEQARYERFMNIPPDATFILDMLKIYGPSSLDTLLICFPSDCIDYYKKTIINLIKSLLDVGLIEIERIQEKRKK